MRCPPSGWAARLSLLGRVLPTRLKAPLLRSHSPEQFGASLGLGQTRFGHVSYCREVTYTASLGIRRIQDNIVIVGLPDAAVKESRDRVMTALINSGFNFTFGRTTINLAPADVKKEGPSFDLPIAIGMVAASEQTETDQLENFMVVGELALDGGVRPVKGVLPIALRARAEGKVGVLVAPENAAEAAVVAGLQVIPIHNLRQVTSFLEGQTTITPTPGEISLAHHGSCPWTRPPSRCSSLRWQT